MEAPRVHGNFILRNNSSVAALLFSSCLVNDEGVKAFLQHGHPNSPIQQLILSCNRVGAIGALLLRQTASSRTAMESLTINHNDAIGYDGLVSMAMELPQIVLNASMGASKIRKHNDN
jgi:hypothetical protein